MTDLAEKELELVFVNVANALFTHPIQQLVIDRNLLTVYDKTNLILDQS